MENKTLIDLGIRFGLNSQRLSKVADMVYQCGIEDLNSKEAADIMNFVCEKGLVDDPSEEIIEALRLEGFLF